MTFSFSWSDKPVYTTASLKPISPCKPSQAMAQLVFSYIWYPYPAIPGRVYDFPDVSTQGWGAHMKDSPIWGKWTHSDLKLDINSLELKAVIIALHHWVTVLRGHQVMIATDNTTIVSYINKRGVTHSHTLLRLVVDLFLWLQTQDIAIRDRHIPGCLNVIADHLSQPNQPITTKKSLHPTIVNRIFRTWGTPTVDMFATVHNRHLLQFMSPIPEPQALAIDALSQDWQGRLMYMFPPFPLLHVLINVI